MFEPDKFYTIELEHVTGQKLTSWGLVKIKGILVYDKIKEALEDDETTVVNVYEVDPVADRSILLFDFFMIEKLNEAIENDKKKNLH